MSGASVMPRLFKVRDLEAGAGTTVRIEATADERSAIADAFALPEVGALSAAFSVDVEGKGRFELTGTVHAEIVQTCVVTVEPVAQVIDEAIALSFVPEGSAAARRPAGGDLDPEAPEPPEVYEGDSIDLGAIAVEHFALAIDPYPRAPGAEFPQEGMGDAADPADSPFSALARLKPGDEQGQ